MTQKFNKSEIMKAAHRIRNHSWNCTMSQALKEAWRRAKKESAQREESEKRMASMKSSKADQRNARMYQHVVFGKNDWVIGYGRKYRY